MRNANGILTGIVLAVAILLIVLWRKGHKTSAFIGAGLVALAGLVYLIFYGLTQNVTIAVDQANVKISDPIGSGDLAGGIINGVLPLIISNPTPYGQGITITSISAVITDPSGTVLATIEAPTNIELPGNGSIVVPLAFTADVDAAVISAVTQFFSTKSESATISGRAYFLGGLVWYTFSDTVSIKI